MTGERRRMMEGGDKPVFVDWIQNTGQEYILLPYTPNRYTYVAAYLYVPSGITGDFFYWGRRESNNKNEKRMGNYENHIDIRNNQVGWWDIDYNGFVNKKQLVRLVLGTYNKIDAVYLSDFDLSNERYKAGTVTSDYTFTTPGFPLFGGMFSDNGVISVCPALLKIYRFIIGEYDHSDFSIINSVLDLQACHYHGEYGLWDNINNTFHGNASGQGQFTGGYDE